MYVHRKEGRGEDMEGRTKGKFEKQTGNHICQGNKTLHFLSVSKAESELATLEKAPVANYILTAGWLLFLFPLVAF